MTSSPNDLVPGKRSGRGDADPDTPSQAIWSIAAGVAPLPFLFVYSVIFIAHGFFWPVEPPDITTTRHGEAAAGVLAVVVAIAIVLTLWWFLSARRRWPHLLAQLAVLGTTIGFVADPRTGSPVVPIALIVTSALSLGLGLHPASAAFVGSRTSRRRRRRPARAARPSVLVEASPSEAGGDRVGVPTA
jgi:hypothetical protein